MTFSSTLSAIIKQAPKDTLAAALVARMLFKVETFNRDVVALPIPEVPTIMSKQRVEWAKTALNEELTEFGDACESGDVLEAADALIDLVYFALGRIVEMGVPAAAVMDEVQRANMGKKQGELSKRPGAMGHDAVKPEGWKAPDHSWLLSFTLADVGKSDNWDALSPVLKEIVELRRLKGEDYNNVSGGRQAYFPFGHVSYAHMINTKSLRIQSLLNSMASGRKPNFESLKDSVRDLVNYSLYYAEDMDSGPLSTNSSARAEEKAGS